MQAYHYHLVDVFTDQRFGGNQLAVFTDASGLSAEMMQTLARELNLSESAFVLPPEDADNHYRVRFFTPAMELPMAGHPTIGTAFVLQREGMIPDAGIVRFEEGVGTIPVALQTRESGFYAYMSQPAPIFGSVRANRGDFARLLSLSEADLHPDYPIQGISSGVPFMYIPIRSLEAIKRINLRVDVWESLLKDDEYPHIVVFTPETEASTSTVHTRMFAPAMSIPEDPATGAASGPLGAYLVKHGIVPAQDAGDMVSEQGYEMQRPRLDSHQRDARGRRYSASCGWD